MAKDQRLYAMAVAIADAGALIEEERVAVINQAYRSLVAVAPKQPKPLSQHARGELNHVARSPVPCSSINPGVCRRLLADGLAEIVNLKSPFPTHNGSPIQHLRATGKGRALLGMDS